VEEVVEVILPLQGQAAAGQVQAHHGLQVVVLRGDVGKLIHNNFLYSIIF
jgi:hypothetical protein